MTTKWFQCPRCFQYRIPDQPDAIPLCLICNGTPCVSDPGKAKKYARPPKVKKTEPTDAELDDKALDWLLQIRE